MDERLRFVARVLEGEKMAVACRDFGISRKTGYKIFNRYKEEGLRGLEDRSPPSEQAGLPARGGHIAHQARTQLLGRTEDTGQALEAIPGHSSAGGQQHSWCTRQPRPDQAAQTPPAQGTGHRAQ